MSNIPVRDSLILVFHVPPQARKWLCQELCDIVLLQRNNADNSSFLIWLIIGLIPSCQHFLIFFWFLNYEGTCIDKIIESPLNIAIYHGFYRFCMCLTNNYYISEKVNLFFCENISRATRTYKELESNWNTINSEDKNNKKAIADMKFAVSETYLMMKKIEAYQTHGYKIILTGGTISLSVPFLFENTWLILKRKKDKWACSISGHFKQKCRHVINTSLTCFLEHFMIHLVF